jgi:replicative DNA helicase
MADAAARAPLQNIEAEQALLGALLLNNEVAEQLSALEARHFYDPVHGLIYGTAMGMIANGQIASPVTMKPFLAENEGLAELGGVDYLARLAGAAISIIAAPHYARSIRDLSARRDVIGFADEMQARAASFTEGSIDDLLDTTDREITELRVAVGEADLVHSLQRVLLNAVTWANNAYQRDGVPEISTGLRNLDEILGGLQRGRLYLLIGTSSMGKSALGISTAMALVRQGIGVLFASFEMPGEEIGHRLVSERLAQQGCFLSHFDIARGQMTEEQFRRYIEASKDIERLPFLTAEDDTLQITRLRAAIVRARKLLAKSPTPLGAIFIDYLQLIRVAGTKDRVSEVGHAVRELKQWAKEFNVPVVALAQAKPEVEDRKDRRPGKRDIQWASEAHQAADAVISVYRHEYYVAQLLSEAEKAGDEAEVAQLSHMKARCAGVVELIVSKQRGGPLGTAFVYANLATNQFSDDDTTTRRPAAAAAIEDKRQHEFADFGR